LSIVVLAMMRIRKPSAAWLAAFHHHHGVVTAQQRRSLVSFHGHSTRLSPRRRHKNNKQPTATVKGGIHNLIGDKPPNPKELLSDDQQAAKVQTLLEWFQDKKQVLCLTGAGLSTESGIPDYRGHQGSYHKGHKPMVHDQFMNSEYQRKRYWGRGMVGWKPFESVQPNAGHMAIAKLEQLGQLGVHLEDSSDFYDPHGLELEWPFSSGQQTLALITQNVDSLHRRAGSRAIVELHGRTDHVKCMTCGAHRDRYDFHGELETLNREWLDAALSATSDDALRPDGDAAVQTESYDEILIPPCTECGSFVKPDVVFFGDSVPKHRVRLCETAVSSCEGLLVVGSSLAVHSAFRHVRAACQQGIPVAILNVGETRAEVEGLPVLKIEAPAGPTLESVVCHLEAQQSKTQQQSSSQHSSMTKRMCPSSMTSMQSKQQ